MTESSNDRPTTGRPDRRADAAPPEVRPADTDADKVRRLHALGLPRKAIARRIGQAPEEVSRIARELGLTFVRREPTRSAARVQRAEARRAKRIADTQRLLRRLESVQVDSDADPYAASRAAVRAEIAELLTDELRNAVKPGDEPAR